MRSNVLRWIGALGVVFLVGCGAAEKAAQESTSASGSRKTTDGVSSALTSVAADLQPDSLETSTRSSKSLVKEDTIDSDNPCSIVNNDIYACQPVLLRLYLDIAEMVVGMAKQIVEDVGNHLGSLPDGSAGTVTEGNQTIQYSKTSDTHFGILISVSGTPAGYISVADTVYTLKMNLENFVQDDDNAPQAMDMNLTYTDANTWTATLFFNGMTCKTDDPRAPERIHIRVAKESGFWKGKAMLYNGRWRGANVSCSTAESDDLSMNIYTDFVANDTAARASVYLMPRNKSDLSDIADWGMDSLGTHFMTEQSQPSYANPYCNRASNLTALWNNTCSSIDATVAATEYGPASDWIVPSEFYQKTITVPSSL